jgi:hypothetical protein
MTLGLTLLLLLAQLTSGVQAQRLFVRVVDTECHPIPGVAVKFLRAGDSPGQAIATGVTDSKGQAFFDAVSESKYDVIASLRNFIPTRVGPFTATAFRSSRPVLVVLNLEGSQ